MKGFSKLSNSIGQCWPTALPVVNIGQYPPTLLAVCLYRCNWFMGDVCVTLVFIGK